MSYGNEREHTAINNFLQNLSDHSSIDHKMNTLRLYLATYNIGTNSPAQNLNSFLDFPSPHNKGKPMPDFYIISLQELKSQPQNMVIDFVTPDPWMDALNKILCKIGYVQAKNMRLQGLSLMIYTKVEHLTHLRFLEGQYTRTGLGGFWGNKGAVSVRFNIYGCSFCFVNSHLSAHDNMLEGRISDYNSILKTNTFHVDKTENIMYHDYVFWMGDLNFRLVENGPATAQDVIRMISAAEKDDYSKLLDYDQLRLVMETGEAFSELQENQPRFPPTFKFEVGTNEYNLKRRPAWTDRILYRVSANNYENVKLKAEQLSYQCLPQYTISDHKPVTAEFNVKVRASQNKIKTITLMPLSFSSNQPILAHTIRTTNDGDNLAGAIEEEADVFSHYSESCIEFLPITDIWYIGDYDFETKCTLSADVVVNPKDWIGIYDANFESLDDYITYEYLAKVNTPDLENQSGSVTFNICFPVGSGVRTPGYYRFLYISQPSSDVRSLLGMSDPFEARVKDSEDGIAANPVYTIPQPDEPSTSSAVDAYSFFQSRTNPMSSFHHRLSDLSID